MLTTLLPNLKSLWLPTFYVIIFFSISVPDNTFNSDKDGSQERRGSSSKVIERLRKSVTEPLLHYFHELQVSPDSQEPEILNTPRSVIPPPNCINNNNSSNNNNNNHLYNLRRRSRNLFHSKKEGYENVSPTIEELDSSSRIPESSSKIPESSSPPKSKLKTNQIPPPIITDM